MIIFLLLVALMVFSGCATDEADLGSSSVPIVGGTEDAADPEVFMLDFRSAVGTINMCSATLVSKRVLLTAGHCLDPKVTPSFLPIRATNKTNAKTAPDSDFIDVVDSIFHPEYDALHAADGKDLALALLERAPEGVTPKPMNTAPLDDLPGQPVRVTGYGYTVQDDYTSFGTKMEVTLPVREVEPLQFKVDDDGDTKGICNGDSGGPSFHTFGDAVERVVGVHSTTETDNCWGSVDVRVDAHIDFINQAIAQLENPDGGTAVDAPAEDGAFGDSSVDDGGPGTDAAEFDGGVTDAFPADVAGLPDAVPDSDTGAADVAAAPDAALEDDVGLAQPLDAAGGKKPNLSGDTTESGGCGCSVL